MHYKYKALLKTVSIFVRVEEFVSVLSGTNLSCTFNFSFTSDVQEKLLMFNQKIISAVICASMPLVGKCLLIRKLQYSVLYFDLL